MLFAVEHKNRLFFYIEQHTSMEPFSWMCFIMSTPIKKGIIKGRMLVYNMTHKGLEFGPNYSSITTESSRGTPKKVVFTWLNPVGQNLTSFLFCQLAENLSYF